MRALIDAARSNFFALPALAVIVAYVGARLAIGIEGGSWLGDATVDSARAVLATVAAATITFASITFSVALLIMQQGSAQFSPRVIAGLTRDPFNRWVIAAVVGTFTYCLVVLQQVRGPVTSDGEARIPNFAAWLGLILGLGAVLAVVAAIHHTARQMDVSNILGRVVAEARRTTVDLGGSTTTTDDHVPAGVPSSVVRFTDSGWVRQVDIEALLATTPEGGTLRLGTSPGRYAILSTVVATVWPALPHDELEAASGRIRTAVRVGPTRTMVEDATYGVRQLVDVALKALSPGVNDPTTAQDAIGHLGTLLVVRLCQPASPTAYSGEGDRRVLVPHAPTDADLAQLALGELRLAVTDKPTVAIALIDMVADVLAAIDQPGRGDALVDHARHVVDDLDTGALPDDERRRVRAAWAARFDRPAAAERGAGHDRG